MNWTNHEYKIAYKPTSAFWLRLRGIFTTREQLRQKLYAARLQAFVTNDTQWG